MQSYNIKFKIIFALIFFAGVFLLPKISWGATINAASCEPGAVQSLINSAAAGDTVQIPACNYVISKKQIANMTGSGQGGSCRATVPSHGLSTGARIATSPGQVTGMYCNCADQSCSVTKVDDNTLDIGTYTGGTWSGSASAYIFPRIEITKSVTVQGSGITATNYTANDGVAFVFSSPVSGLARLTNLSISQTAGSDIMGIVKISGNPHTWRVDHIKFTGIGVSTPISVFGSAWGVIDHIEAMGWGTGVRFWGDAREWTKPLSFGTDDAVYIEDSLFDNLTIGGGSNAIDGDTGGRYVFRYNTLKKTVTGHHGLDTNNVGLMQFEVYGNTVQDIGSGQGFAWCSSARSGTGMVFNNKCYLTGTSLFYYFAPRNYRSDPSPGSMTCSIMNGKCCDGSNVQDGNEPAPGFSTGTHTGSNGSSNLVDVLKNWVANFWITSPYTYSVINFSDGVGTSVVYGQHNGANSSTVMRDSTKNWAANQWVGYQIYNLTYGSNCTITSSDINSVTCADGLKGGSGQTWKAGDPPQYAYGTFYTIKSWSAAKITNNDATTISGTLAGGTKNIWDASDNYRISNGYPCRQQVGRGTNNALAPVYVWGNKVYRQEAGVWTEKAAYNGWGLATGGNSGLHIQEGRDICEKTGSCSGNNCNTSCGSSALNYTAYAYPHPLAVGGVPPPPSDTTPPASPTGVQVQ